MFSHFAIFDVGTPELILILAIALLLFGGKKLPELSRSIGESIAEIKKSASGVSDLKHEVKGQVSQVKEDLASSETKS